MVWVLDGPVSVVCKLCASTGKDAQWTVYMCACILAPVCTHRFLQRDVGFSELSFERLCVSATKHFCTIICPASIPPTPYPLPTFWLTFHFRKNDSWPTRSHCPQHDGHFLSFWEYTISA